MKMAFHSTVEDVKHKATLLAKAHKKVEPDLQESWWFPSETEIRLVEVEPGTFKNDFVAPFFFDTAPEKGIRVPSGIAIIRPDEVQTLPLPAGWCEWSDAQRLEV
jgi:hypothetical protein